jgi:HSP70 co-chaperone SNL1
MAQDIDEYYAGYQEYTKDDRTYKLNYFQEELLKELIKLDDVDLTVIQDQERKLELKQLRKDAIKRIQGLLKGLDEFKGKL